MQTQQVISILWREIYKPIHNCATEQKYVIKYARMRRRKQSRKTETQLNKDVAIADIPVKIVFLDGDRVLIEYNQVVSLEFGSDTPAGQKATGMVHALKARGLDTEEALFTLASETVREHSADLKPIMASGHSEQSIHFHVKRNGNITYRKPVAG
jgi:hypothetical protein